MNYLSNLTAEQKVQRAKVYIMTNPEWRWLAGVVMLGTMEFTDDAAKCPTAATDGLNEIYNRAFISAMGDEEVRAAVLHENLHKAFRHLFVWDNLFKECPQIANIACDVVINNQILDGKPGIKLGANWVYMPEYADESLWNAKRIYDELMDKAKKEGRLVSVPTFGGGKTSDSHDQHDTGKSSNMTEGEVKEIQKQVDSALRQAMAAGNEAGGMPRSIQEMMVPPVDWRSLLAEFVKSVCAGRDKQTWRRPHRTYVAYDLYMPAQFSESVGRILIGGDTSGSIGDEMLGKFLGYMQQLVDEVNPDGVDIAWWDTKVAGVDTFERGSMSGLAAAVKPAGGGGTSPECVPEWMRQEGKTNYVCAVMLTDGEFYGDSVGDWGDLPTIWLVVNDRVVPDIPVGVTIHVNELV